MKLLNIEADRYSDDAQAVLASIGEVDEVDVGGHEELVAALAKQPYDALLTRLGVGIDAAVFDAAPNLRWVVTPTTGLDHIDTEAATQRGIEVVSLKGETAFLATITPTAEHTWALLLALRRRLVAAHNHVVGGGWERAPFVGAELTGATLGIVGHGRLGRMVAGYGRAFGMEVLVHDRSEPSSDPEMLLANADVVSLHLPLDETTTGWLSAERFALMKAGAVLVNTARGELVDEAALLDNLTTGHLAGAALDVIAGDSRWEGSSPTDHPLVRYAAEHDNLIVTPHVGGYGRDAIRRTREFVAQKLKERACRPS